METGNDLWFGKTKSVGKTPSFQQVTRLHLMLSNEIQILAQDYDHRWVHYSDLYPPLQGLTELILSFVPGGKLKEREEG